MNDDKKKNSSQEEIVLTGDKQASLQPDNIKRFTSPFDIVNVPVGKKLFSYATENHTLFIEVLKVIADTIPEENLSTMIVSEFKDNIYDVKLAICFRMMLEKVDDYTLVTSVLKKNNDSPSRLKSLNHNNKKTIVLNDKEIIIDREKIASEVKDRLLADPKVKEFLLKRKQYIRSKAEQIRTMIDKASDEVLADALRDVLTSMRAKGIIADFKAYLNGSPDMYSLTNKLRTILTHDGLLDNIATQTDINNLRKSIHNEVEKLSQKKKPKKKNETPPRPLKQLKKGEMMQLILVQGQKTSVWKYYATKSMGVPVELLLGKQLKTLLLKIFTGTEPKKETLKKESIHFQSQSIPLPEHDNNRRDDSKLRKTLREKTGYDLPKNCLNWKSNCYQYNQIEFIFIKEKSKDVRTSETYNPDYKKHQKHDEDKYDPAIDKNYDY